MARYIRLEMQSQSKYRGLASSLEGGLPLRLLFQPVSFSLTLSPDLFWALGWPDNSSTWAGTAPFWGSFLISLMPGGASDPFLLGQ